MLNFPVNKSINFNYGYGNYLPIKKNKEQQLKQITDNDYKNYSNAISAMNKSIVSFGANNYTTQLDPKNKELREKIFQIDGWCFEKLAGYIFENAQNENGKKLFDNVEVTKASGDGGVDILLETNPDLILDNQKKRTLVQCKHNSKGNWVDIETMQQLADCREKEMFQGKYKKEDINCLMIASSGVNNNVLTYYLPKIKDFDYKIMNLDDLIDFAKKHKVKIDDEVLNPLIEETKERCQCHQELLSQKNRIKEMIDDESMTIDEVIKILNDEFKGKYPHIVKGNYISNFIKHAFNPPECFELLKQKGYKFEENLGTGKQIIFSVKKDNETFVVYYSNRNNFLNNHRIDSAKNSIDKVKTNKDDKLILISISGFCEGTKTSDSLKNFDKVYTVVNDELQEYDGIPKKIRPIVDLLKQEGFEFEENLSVNSAQTIFSVKKGNETFVVYYGNSNIALSNIYIENAKNSIDKVKTNKDDKLILISTSNFQEGTKTSDSLKNFDKVYTVVNDELQEYDGIPEKIRPIVDLLKQEGFEFEENLSVNSAQTIFSVKKGNETLVVYYNNTNTTLGNVYIDRAKNSIDKVKTNKDDKLILISTSDFQEGTKTSDSLKNFDKVYTVVNDELQEYDGIPEKIRPIVDLLKQEGFEFEENLSVNSAQTIFSVKKNGKTFIVSCSKQNKVLYTMVTNKLLKSIDDTNKNKDGIILVTKNGIYENGKEGFDEKTIQDENGNEYIIYIKDLIISPAEI